MSNRKGNTDKTELVETHNLVLSLNRLSNTPPYDTGRWKRALYHALLMADGPGWEERQKIREALKLP